MADWRTASRESTGVAPDPAVTSEAVIQVYAARAYNWRGLFGVHTWVAAKPKDALTGTKSSQGEIAAFLKAAKAAGGAGQLQRIGLARAVYGTPRYVILDEPNSNLDAAGDDALSQAILTLREQGSTVVVMAHRPSAIAAVNKVLVLHSGRVAEFGPKEDVLQKSVRPPAGRRKEEV